MAKIEIVNTDLELGVLKAEEAEYTLADFTFTGVALVFSVETGNVYTITAAAIGGDLFTDGDTIKISGSVQAAVEGVSPEINNDGLYTVVDANISANAISVLEPVVAATSDDEDNTVDEYDRFEITPTRGTDQLVIYIRETGNEAGATFSIAPGVFWAAFPLSGTITENVMNLIQIESGKYLDADGKIQLSIFPAAGGNLNTDHGIIIGLIQLR